MIRGRDRNVVWSRMREVVDCGVCLRFKELPRSFGLDDGIGSLRPGRTFLQPQIVGKDPTS